MTIRAVSVLAAQIESEFTPQLWNSIISLKPQLNITFRNLMDQGVLVSIWMLNSSQRPFWKVSTGIGRI